jgi:hypothetical protein
LEMSSLMKRAGRLALCNALMTLCTYKKLSWIHLYFIKAFWQVDTRSFSFGTNLSAMTFVIIFAKLLIRLMGLKSVMDAASGVFGSKTTFASLIRSSFWVRSE